MIGGGIRSHTLTAKKTEIASPSWVFRARDMPKWFRELKDCENEYDHLLYTLYTMIGPFRVLKDTMGEKIKF